jgi:HEAT repeat protein
MPNKDYIKTAVSYLSKTLEDNQPKASAALARTLSTIKPEDAIPGLLIALEDSNVNVRLDAAEALGQVDIDTLDKIGLDKTILSFINSLSDTNDNVRLSAINAIGKICSR